MGVLCGGVFGCSSIIDHMFGIASTQRYTFNSCFGVLAAWDQGCLEFMSLSGEMLDRGYYALWVGFCLNGVCCMDGEERDSSLRSE